MTPLYWPASRLIKKAMIPELGHFALILALFMAGAHTLPLLCRQAALLQFFLCLTAFAAFMWAGVTYDFTVAVVAENAHTLKPFTSNIVATLGTQAGLVLLGLLAFSFGGAFLAVKKPEPVQLRLIGLTGAVLISFALFVAHPFDRIDPPPFDGIGYDPFAQEAGK